MAAGAYLMAWDNSTSSWIKVVANSSGALTTSGGGGGSGTQYTEDVASTGGESLTLAGAIRQDTPATSTSADGDYSNLKTDSSGRLWVNGSGTTQPVSGTFWQATQPVSIAAAVAVTDNAGSLTVDAPVGTPVFVRLSDGAAAISTLPVSLASVPSHAVTNAGTFVVQENGSALTSLQLIDDTIVADDAAFTVGTTKVNMAGGYVVAHGANPDAADAGDAGAVLMNRHRIPFTMGGHPNTVSAEYYSTGNITNDNILPAIAAGTKYVITSITVSASAANTTNATVRIGFGTAAVPTQGATNADAVAKVVMSLPGIPPGGGAVKGNGGGIVGVGGDGEEPYVTITNMASGALTIVIDYYTIES